jgi:hypothetical protein
MPKKVALISALSLILVFALSCAKNADSIVNEPAIPDTPDGTVLAAKKAIQDNRLEFFWYALPESYRQFITEITRAFSEKMDPVIYDRAFAIVMRAIEVLDDRKDIILASETFQSFGADVDADEIRQSLSNTQVFTEILKGSEIATLEGLGTVDWEQFLATTGAQMLENAAALEIEGGEDPFDELDSLEVETLEASEDQATLKISTKNHEPEEVEMVRVEGRWIPKEMADEWPQFVEDAREGLAEMTPENMAAQKTQIMMFFGMADGFIEQIASLQTPEEFDAAIGPMLAPLLGGASMDMGEDDELDDTEWEVPEEEPEDE